MISGSVLVSVVLGLQTIGPALLTALKTQVIGTMISDLLLVLLDPRIRYGDRKG